MRGRLGTIGLAAVIATLVPSNGVAQEAPPGFGKRSSTVLSVENLIGKLDVSPGQGTTISESWMGGPFVPHLGVFGMGSNGVGGGVAFAFLHFTPDRGNGVTLFDVRPRIAYAGSVSPIVGAWLRAGPNVFYVSTQSEPFYAFGVGGEALAVVTPTPHFGVFGGLTLDFPIYGKQKDRDEKFTITGLTVGLLADF